ncbi:hypothetical protein [Methanobrevibacter sp.]|uniref:hypothetical protein n=1 Tax=Methanobrevibacter sp. TaxID=66852 RepID=UPI00388F92A5
MEFLNQIIELLNNGKSDDVIDRITSFLDENPQYRTIDYYHFANPLEELLFDEYIEKIESVKTLDLDKPLEEVYTIYSIAYMNKGNLDEAERYLKIANQINPVSAPILMRLCELYQAKHEEEKLKELTCDIFKYAYDVAILTSNYFKLADYLFHTNQDMELYDHLFNFYLFLRSGEEENRVSDDVNYLKEKDIQVGANPEVLLRLMYLIDVHTQQNMPNAAEYFRNIFNELSEFTKYLNNL